jgi:hypothetical protein
MLDRRRFLQAGLAGATLLAFPKAAASASATGTTAADHADLLENAEFAYVSPLKKDGSESRCHAEVWYAWIDGAVVMTVSSSGWKATAIGNGLGTARIWVGDHGRLKGLQSGSQDFRKGVTFDARAETSNDMALLERLLAEYERKYPKEIANWRDKMREGTRDGSRVTIRYTPL